MDIKPQITPRQQYILDRLTRRTEAYRLNRSVTGSSGFAWATVFILFALSLFTLIPKPGTYTANNYEIKPVLNQEPIEPQQLGKYKNVIWHKKSDYLISNPAIKA